MNYFNGEKRYIKICLLVLFISKIIFEYYAEFNVDIWCGFQHEFLRTTSVTKYIDIHKRTGTDAASPNTLRAHTDAHAWTQTLLALQVLRNV